jgi:uncharacterized protein (DUF1697 family)
MKTYIALFRGINVGGHNKMPMKELSALLEGLGLSGVRTYIQSGNVVFRANKGTTSHWSTTIRTAVEGRFGFSPWVLVMEAAALARAAAANPYPEAEADHKTLHLFFLAAKPKLPDLEAIERIKSPTESCTLLDTVFYLHAPDGIGKSKLAERAERLLGVEATARNWRTVREVLALASGANP